MDPIQERVTGDNTTPAPTQNTPTFETPYIQEIAAAQPFYKKYAMYIAIAAGVLIVLGAGYYAYTAYYAKGGTVAVVNGMHIYQNEFNESISLIEKNAEAQGLDLAEESIKSEIRTQALEVLVNNALLITAAEDVGITVTDADVQAKYDELVTQLGTQEELTKRMAELGLTEEKLRSNIEERILADEYIETQTDIENLTVTEAEVTEFVKSISTEGTELPPIEEIRPQIEAEILSQKQQQVVTDLIAKLRTEAQIDVRI